MRPNLRTCAAVLLTGLALPSAASAADPQTLGVLGRGDVEVAPDVGSFEAEVVRTAPTSATARRRANLRLRAIVRSVTALGVPRSSVTTTSVSLVRATRRDRRTHVRTVYYVAAGAFAVRVEGLDRLGRALDASAAAGATGLDGPSFSFSSARQTEARLASERLALADARRRADDAAASQGQRVSGVQSIELDPSSGASPAAEADLVSSPASSGSSSRPAVATPVLPGTQTFASVVRVVYTLAPAT